MFNFTADTALPADLAKRMQALADKRAASGLSSEDGKTHKNAAAKAVYENGYSTKSEEYLNAAFGK